MYVYSSWWNVQAPPARMEGVVSQLTSPRSRLFDDKRENSLWLTPVAFHEKTDNDWEKTDVDGERWFGFADVPLHVDDSRLVGMMAPTQALLQSLRAMADMLFSEAKMEARPTHFSLRTLFGGQQLGAHIEPTSVRVEDDGVNVVLQGESSKVLRERALQSYRHITGATFTFDDSGPTQDEQFTVFQDGTLVFDGTTAADNVLTIMSALANAAQSPMATGWA